MDEIKAEPGLSLERRVSRKVSKGVALERLISAQPVALGIIITYIRFGLYLVVGTSVLFRTAPIQSLYLVMFLAVLDTLKILARACAIVSPSLVLTIGRGEGCLSTPVEGNGPSSETFRAAAAHWSMHLVASWKSTTEDCATMGPPLRETIAKAPRHVDTTARTPSATCVKIRSELSPGSSVSDARDEFSRPGPPRRASRTCRRNTPPRSGLEKIYARSETRPRERVAVSAGESVRSGGSVP